jgi:hypothetical protein
MANTTVSIRERIKTDAGWRWSKTIPIPEGKLNIAEAQRKGKFHLVYTERGRKREPKVKGKTFEVAVLAARAKQRHLEDAADGFKRPDPLQPIERHTIADAIERFLQRVEVSQDPDTLKAYRQSLRQFERWTDRKFVDEIDHDHLMAYRNWLVKNGNEKKNAKTKGNDKLTADWKALRVNKLVKVTMGLPHGNTPRTTSDDNKRKSGIGLTGEIVRRESRWTSAADATPARELVRSTR